MAYFRVRERLKQSVLLPCNLTAVPSHDSHGSKTSIYMLGIGIGEIDLPVTHDR